MVRTLRFHSSGVGGTLIPGWGIKSPQVEWHNQKKRKRRVSVVIKRTLERCFLRMGNTLSPPRSPQPPHWERRLQVESTAPCHRHAARAGRVQGARGLFSAALIRRSGTEMTAVRKGSASYSQIPRNRRHGPTCRVPRGSTRDCQEVEAAREEYR